MLSLPDLIRIATSLGLYSAESAHVRGEDAVLGPGREVHYCGDDAGQLALEAFRAHGAEGLVETIRAYTEGYNAQARHQGDAQVSSEQVTNGIPYVLWGATAEEIREMTHVLRISPQR